MLVLSRKEGEQLLVGDNIVLTINRISGNRVAIGIDAPKEVPIVRGELERAGLPAGRVSETQVSETHASEEAGRLSESRGVSGLSALMTPLSISVASGAGG